MFRELTELRSKYLLGLITKNKFIEELKKIIDNEASSDRERWLAKAFLYELE